MLQQAQRLDCLSRPVLRTREVVFDSLCSRLFFGFMGEIKSVLPSLPISGVSGGTSQEQGSISTSDVSVETCSGNAQRTPEIEKTYVHRVYDAIAPHFSSTRFAKWPKVAAFLSSLPAGSLVLDAGCGNGKYLGLNPNCFFIGTGFGDAAISIAVLHHLSSENRRRMAIEELVRVVKKGGLVLITVWALEQEDRNLVSKWTPLTQKYLEEWIGPSKPHLRISRPLNLQGISEGEEEGFQELQQSSDEISNKNTKQVQKPNVTRGAFESSSNNVFNKSQNEYFVPWHLPYHRAEVGGASVNALQNGLARRDDKKGAVVYNRYYHVFSQGELERLVCDMDNTMIVDQFFDKSNWGVVLEKIR